MILLFPFPTLSKLPTNTNAYFLATYFMAEINYRILIMKFNALA